MAELHQVFSDISANPGLVKHYVMTSDVAGVFNFGGDLSLFVLLIRARDRESLKMYGRGCIDLVWWMETAAQRGVHTTVLVQGDTLGGGLESVLPFHKVIFERSAQAGFPAVLFNLFPGMWAWDFTLRKAGFAVANEMVLSGRLYTADQLYRRGHVDLVVEDGEGEAAIEHVVRGVHRSLHAVDGRWIVPAPLEFQSRRRWCSFAAGRVDARGFKVHCWLVVRPRAGWRAAPDRAGARGERDRAASAARGRVAGARHPPAQAAQARHPPRSRRWASIA